MATDAELIVLMRAALLDPNRGVVRLQLKGPYFDAQFARKCVDELERRLLIAGVGLDTLTPLEKLAAYVLMDSAGFGDGTGDLKWR